MNILKLVWADGFTASIVSLDTAGYEIAARTGRSAESEAESLRRFGYASLNPADYIALDDAGKPMGSTTALTRFLQKGGVIPLNAEAA